MKVKEPTPQYLVDEEGKKEYVVLKIDQYENLIEDLHDLVVMAERRDEKRVSLDQFKDDLKKDGLL